MACVEITLPKRLVEISPLIYGDFLEFIGRQTAVMWGERLDDRKFAGFLPSKPEFHFLPEEESLLRRPWREAVWSASGRAVLDDPDPYCGDSCMRIEVTDVEQGGRVGLRQEVWVTRGEPLVFSGYFRAAGPVRVRLAVGRFMGCFVQPYGPAAEFEVTGERWHKFEAAVTSEVSDEEADFVLLVQSKGTLWVDSLSLLSENDLHRCRGWRKDIVEAIKALRPGAMRFGGSEMNHYEWRWGRGDRDKRAPFPRYYWGGIESNDVGIDEFLDLCALVEAEPLICINACTEGPEDAVAFMEHCAKREAGPRVRLWQVGNELSGEQYERALPEFCRAMRSVDPNASLLTSYPPSEATLKAVAGLVTHVAPHYYELSIEKAANETAMLRERLSRLPEIEHLKLAVTEWNETGGRWGPGRGRLSTLGNGLFVGRMLNHFRRNGDLINIANRSNIADSWHSGSIQVYRSRIWFHPAYLVQRLFSNHGGRRLLQIEGDAGDLDMTAALDDVGNICLTVVNLKSEPAPLEAKLTLGRALSSARVFQVSGEDEWTCNHCAEPERIGVEERRLSVSSDVLRWDVPAHTAAVVVVGGRS
jgi:alpha-N-arabinofuranosidase